MKRKLMTDKQLKVFQAKYKRPVAIPAWVLRYTNLVKDVKVGITLDKREADWAKENNLYQVYDGVFISTAELEIIRDAASSLCGFNSWVLANKLREIVNFAPKGAIKK